MQLRIQPCRRPRQPPGTTPQEYVLLFRPASSVLCAVAPPFLSAQSLYWHAPPLNLEISESASTLICIRSLLPSPSAYANACRDAAGNAFLLARLLSVSRQFWLTPPCNGSGQSEQI